MGAYPPFELAKSISRRKAGAQPGGLETSGGVGITLSIPCRPALLVLLNFKMAGGLKVGSPTIGGQKLQTYSLFSCSDKTKQAPCVVKGTKLLNSDLALFLPVLKAGLGKFG